MSPIKLVVGLKNPGSSYAGTRHNAGAWFIEKICSAYNFNLKQDKKFNCEFTKCNLNDHDIHLLLPGTYMNESGQVIVKFSNYFNIKPEQILIAHDDLDLSCGQIKLKTAGGHQGHNGLRDVINKLGSNNFHRLRIGIGHPGDKSQVSNYVLSAPRKEEFTLIDSALEESLNILPEILSTNWQQAMNKFYINRR